MSRLTGVERERCVPGSGGTASPSRALGEQRAALPLRGRAPRRRDRRASAQGVPLAQAVADVLAAPDLPAASIAPGLALESLQSPAVAVRGPRPLEVVWRNGAADTAPAAPLMGDDLGGDPARFGAGAVEVLRRLMAGELTGAQCFEARDWTAAEPHTCRVTAWLVDAPGGAPTAVIAQLPQEAAALAMPARTSDAEPAVARWAQGAAAGREALRQHAGSPGSSTHSRRR